MAKQVDLSSWEAVQRELSKKHSRERRLRAATDLLYDVDIAIRQHEHDHRRLMDAGEIVMPEESVAYGEGLRHVKWQLEREIERLKSLTGESIERPKHSENESGAQKQHPSLSESRVSVPEILAAPFPENLSGLTRR